MYENLLVVPTVVALAAIVKGSPVPVKVPVPVLRPEVGYGMELVALAKGVEVEIRLGPSPGVDFTLVAFTEIEKLADTLGSYVTIVPEDAGIVVALAEIVGREEGSEDEKAVPVTPTIELAE